MSTAAPTAKKPKTKDAKEKPATKSTGRKVPYYNITVTCVCGAEFEAGSTLETVRVDICSNCHPFFTGEKRILDSEGRIEKFRKKYNRDKV